MPDPIASLIPPTLVPSGVRDDRQSALAQTFGAALCAIDLSKFSMVDPLTVDARLLPFMIREFGAQNLIDPDVPEHVQRRVLKSIWNLKSLHGYNAGVKLGLELLGIAAEIEHWWQVDPKRDPNTHIITLFFGDPLFGGDQIDFGARELSAATRMVDATKRLSQSTEYRFGAMAAGTTYAGAFSSADLLCEAHAVVPPPPVIATQARRSVVPTAHLLAEIGG